MKNLSVKIVLPIAVFIFIACGKISAQCQPYIKVDGQIVMADVTIPTGLSLPLWLDSGQTIAVGLTVNSISVIEFTKNGASLEFSRVIPVVSSTAQTVPAGKVWKVESIVKKPVISGGTNKVIYNMAGANTFTVPACTEFICIEAWGGGGGGQGGKNNDIGQQLSGAGGGGGAYGQECFNVTPGASFVVTVGEGGTGGTGGAAPTNGSAGINTTVGTLITANGGSGGVTGGGNGGTCTAALNVAGYKGTAGYVPYSSPGGNGGNGGNGGAGGTGVPLTNGNPGVSPGGGGAGGGLSGSGGTGYNGGKGADGKVIIYW